MRILKYLPAALFLAAAGMILESQLHAATTHRVRIVGGLGPPFRFDPTNITINVGDTVLWTNAASSAHDTTSRDNPPLWASGLMQPRANFSRVFNTVGNFGYRCQAHIVTDPNQTGLVRVVSVNLPPTIALTNPPDKLLVVGPTNIALQASASDPDGSVMSVRFFRDGLQVFDDPTSPYSFTVSNLTAGKYAFTAQAFDNGGLATMSAAVNVTVASPIRLSNAFVDGNKSFRFNYNADTGGTYVVRRSVNPNSPLPQEPISTNIALTPLQSHTETNVSINRTFTVIRTQ